MFEHQQAVNKDAKEVKSCTQSSVLLLSLLFHWS